MDLETIIKKIPYLYHLTDRNNLNEIIATKHIYSTKNLFLICGIDIKDDRLYTRRPVHLTLKNNDTNILIRDQRPLNKALNNCLVGGCTVKEFIFLLNSRVFFLPNLKRLNIHFERYKEEIPVIIRVSTEEILKLNNDRIEITNINSGATRPSGTLGGRAAARGKDTFKKIGNYELRWNTIAEFTILDFCVLPDNIYISNEPNGNWDKVKI